MELISFKKTTIGDNSSFSPISDEIEKSCLSDYVRDLSLSSL